MNQGYQVERIAAALRDPGGPLVTIRWADPDAGCGRYYVRGGISWPTGSLPHQWGALLVGAQDVATSRVFVVGECRFLTIEPVMDPETGALLGCGAAAAFLAFWNGLYCHEYDYREEEHEHGRWVAQLRQAVTIQPRPRFVRQDWNQPNSLGVLGRWYELGRLVYTESHTVYHDVTAATTQPALQGPEFNTIRALCAMLIGFERHPWTARRRVPLGPAAFVDDADGATF